MNILTSAGNLLNGSTRGSRFARSPLQAVGEAEQGLLVATPPQTRNRRVRVINLGA